MPIEHALTKAELAAARKNERLVLVAGIKWKGKLVEFRHVAFLLDVTPKEIVVGLRDAIRPVEFRWLRKEHRWAEPYGDYWLEAFEPWETEQPPEQEGHRFIYGCHVLDASRFTKADQKLHEKIAGGAGFPVRELANDESFIIPDFGPRNKHGPIFSIATSKPEEVEMTIDRMLGSPVYVVETLRGLVKVIKAGSVHDRSGPAYNPAYHVYSCRDNTFLQAFLTTDWLVIYLTHVAKLGAY